MAESKPIPDNDDAADPVTEELVAYLDGELDPKAAEALAAKLGRDPKLRSAVDSLQRTWDILDILPRPQPSATFATRTMSQVAPFAYTSHPAGIPNAHARTGSGFYFAALALIVLAGFAGYFAHRSLVPSPRFVNPDPPTADYPLMKNMRLYRHVDDIDYVRKLDSPELFGEEN